MTGSNVDDLGFKTLIPMAVHMALKTEQIEHNKQYK